MSKSQNSREFTNLMPETESSNSRDHESWNHEMQGSPGLPKVSQIPHNILANLPKLAKVFGICLIKALIGRPQSVDLRQGAPAPMCWEASTNANRCLSEGFHPAGEHFDPLDGLGSHWSIQLWFVSYFYTHSLYHFINLAIVALKSDIVTFYRC